MHKKDSSSIEKHIQAYRAIPQGEAKGQITSTERHNNTALAYECFFLRLLSKGLVLFVILLV